MTKPLVSLADLSFDYVEKNGLYISRHATIGDPIGAGTLGYNLIPERCWSWLDDVKTGRRGTCSARTRRSIVMAARALRFDGPDEVRGRI